MKKDSVRFALIGALLVTIGLTDSFYSLFFESAYDLLWFSNTILILLGIAFALRSRLFMGAMLISSFVEIFWVIDFISHLIFGFGAIGNVTEYMFRDLGYKTINFYLELNHLLVMPFAIYGAYKIGIDKMSYLISSAHAIFLNSLTYLLAPPSLNINCVYHLCFLKSDIFNINDILYLIIWTLMLCAAAYSLNRAATAFFERNSKKWQNTKK